MIIVYIDLFLSIIELISVLYLCIFVIRQRLIIDIIITWIKIKDKRLYKTDLKNMFKINKKNWYGLKFPKYANYE